IQQFFQDQCVEETGLVEKFNVAIYSDEPENYDAPVLKPCC
ncbi:antibiotic biosynthesis monooxygenase, partial [Vibrio breoganii]